MVLMVFPVHLCSFDVVVTIRYSNFSCRLFCFLYECFGCFLCSGVMAFLLFFSLRVPQALLFAFSFSYTSLYNFSRSSDLIKYLLHYYHFCYIPGCAVITSIITIRIEVKERADSIAKNKGQRSEQRTRLMR